MIWTTAPFVMVHLGWISFVTAYIITGALFVMSVAYRCGRTAK